MRKAFLAALVVACTLVPLFPGSARAQLPTLPLPTLPLPTATPGSTVAPDWRGAFTAVWSLDQASDGSSAVARPPSGGACGADCTLADVNGVASDAVNRQEGAAAASFDAAQEERLECPNSVCDELRPGAGKSFTVGCWARPTLDDEVFRVFMNMRTGGGFFFGRDNSGGAAPRQARCTVVNGATSASAASAAQSMPLDTYTHAVCSFDNAADQVRTWINGAPSGAAVGQADVSAPSGAFQLSTDATGNDFGGQLDECFVTDVALSASDVCRICSCGIDGTLCACNDQGYAATGRNATACGGCALPACNQAAPAGGTAPTATATPAPTATPTATPTPAVPLPTLTAVPTTVPARDWGSAFTAVWALDEASSGTTAVTRVATAGSCSAGSDCDLTDVGMTASDAVNKQEGAAAARFDSTEGERLQCASAACDELIPQPGSSFTIGCWSRLTRDDDAFRVIMRAFDFNQSHGFFFGRADNVERRLECAVGNGTETVRADSAVDALPVDTFAHTVCTFDNPNDRLQTWVNGAVSGASATQTDIAAATDVFALSTPSAGAEWDGQLDECFVAPFALAAPDICRICSCGIDGSRCACNGSAYAASGRNATDCGSCALPPCDAPPPAPGAPVPTATAAGTPTASATPVATVTATTAATGTPLATATLPVPTLPLPTLPAPTGTATATSAPPTATVPVATPTATATPSRTPTPTATLALPTLPLPTASVTSVPTDVGTPTPTPASTPVEPLDPDLARAADRCQRGLTKVGTKLAGRRLKTLERCVDVVFACLQIQEPGARRDACLASARQRCERGIDRLAGEGEGARASAVKRCASPLTLEDLRSPAGLGWDALAAACEAAGIPLDSVAAVAACLVRQHECGADLLFGAEAPRAHELLRVGGVPLAAFTCLPDHGGDGDDLGDPEGAGKAVSRCATSIEQSGARLAGRDLRGLGRCVETVLGCHLRKPADARCLERAETRCGRQLALAAREAGTLPARLARRCGDVDFALLAAPAGANLEALADLCAAHGVNALAGLADYEECLVRQHACEVAALLPFEAPRAEEALQAIGRDLRPPFCPTPSPTPTPLL